MLQTKQQAVLDGFRHVFFTELTETPSLCAISLYVRPSSCESRNASRVFPFSPSSMLSTSCRVSSWLSRSSGEGAPPSGISASISRYAFSSAFRRNRSTITRLAIVHRKERGSRIVESVSLLITRKKCPGQCHLHQRQTGVCESANFSTSRDGCHKATRTLRKLW